jgi:uncharacterized membrane protein YcaP (DUF421 family)
MKPEEIHLTDWGRILFGEVPATFFIEVVIRVTVVYLLHLISMRALGKRMAAQLDRIEMAALVTLAAAVGIPLQSAERGLLPGLVIAAVVVVIGRMIGRLSYKSEKFEHLTHGDAEMLVENGTLRLKPMLDARVSPERLWAQLRGQGITHLGQVRRMYIEASGSFSLIPEVEPQPGLCIVPEWDTDFRGQLTQSQDMVVCATCGNRREPERNTKRTCDNCDGTKWVNAVVG